MAEGGEGVGGLHKSVEARERVTPDLAEQRRPVSKRASGGRHD